MSSADLASVPTVLLWTALALLPVTVLVGFLRWRRSALKRLAAGSLVAVTRHGPVEYARRGEGPVLLVLHGGMGGWDQGLFLVEDFREGFDVISPSRGGYLRTPVSTGATSEEMADAIVGLLDDLGIEACGVLGVSGGGPTALAMTLRHPERVRALAMAAAISGRHVQPGLTRNVWMTRILFSSLGGYVLDFFLWVLFRQGLRFLPRLVTRRALDATEELPAERLQERVASIMRTPSQREYLGRLFECSLPLSVRKAGLDNDLARFATLPVYPVEDIRCPTLVVHGRHDGNVPFSHARFVSEGVRGAELFVAETCGHLIWMSDDREPTVDRLRSFFSRHLA